MTVNRKLYPPKSIWSVMRQEALERAGYCCELCGLPDAVECFNRQMIDTQRSLPFGEGFFVALKLIERGCKEQVWLENFR